MEKQTTGLTAWKADLVMIASFLIAGIAFFVMGTAFETNSAFLKGFLTGLGITGGVFTLFLVVRHLITGKSLVKTSDERLAFIKTKASSQCFFVTFFALIAIVFLSYTENPAFDLDVRKVCTSLVAGMGIVFGVLFVFNSRRY